MLINIKLCIYGVVVDENKVVYIQSCCCRFQVQTPDILLSLQGQTRNSTEEQTKKNTCIMCTYVQVLLVLECNRVIKFKEPEHNFVFFHFLNLILNQSSGLTNGSFIINNDRRQLINSSAFINTDFGRTLETF